MTAVLGAVLAGGASSRMGSDKAFVEVQGRAMAMLVAEALAKGGCAPVVCQGGDRTRFATLGLVAWPDADGAPPGPVGAVWSALRSTVRKLPDIEIVVGAACDLPMLDPAVVEALVDTSRATGRAAVASAGGRVHLVGAWPVQLFSDVDRAVESGCRSFRRLVADLPMRHVAVDERFLLNVNTPEEIPGGGGPGR